MKFLVTGATGFIGSNLALELAKKNEVIGLCSLTPGTKDNLKNFKGKFSDTGKAMNYIWSGKSKPKFIK